MLLAAALHHVVVGHDFPVSNTEVESDSKNVVEEELSSLNSSPILATFPPLLSMMNGLGERGQGGGGGVVKSEVCFSR